MRNVRNVRNSVRISALDHAELLAWLVEHALIDYMPVDQMVGLTGQRMYLVTVVEMVG